MDCGGCGKPVQSDWSTCPFCSCEISKVPEKIVFSDNVVMGDFKVNDLDDITKAVGQNSICKNCNSMGSVIIACSVCKELSHCDICKSDLPDLRVRRRLCLPCHDKELVRILSESKLNKKISSKKIKLNGVFDKIKDELKKSKKLIIEYESVSEEITKLKRLESRLGERIPELYQELSTKETQLKESKPTLDRFSRDEVDVENTIAKYKQKFDPLRRDKIAGGWAFFISFLAAILLFLYVDAHLDEYYDNLQFICPDESATIGFDDLLDGEKNCDNGWDEEEGGWFTNSEVEEAEQEALDYAWGWWIGFGCVFLLIVLPLSIVIGDALADQDMSAATKKYNQYMITTGDVYLRELSHFKGLVARQTSACDKIRDEISDCEKIIQIISYDDEGEFRVSDFNIRSRTFNFGKIDVIQSIQNCTRNKNNIRNEFHQIIKSFRTLEHEYNDIFAEILKLEPNIVLPDIVKLTKEMDAVKKRMTK